MKIKSKYPIKISNVLIPRGEEGILYPKDGSDRFKNLNYNQSSNQYLVKFPSFHKEFICSEKQIEIVS